jgi:hypothetical protein
MTWVAGVMAASLVSGVWADDGSTPAAGACEKSSCLEVETSATLDLYSAYVWRGLTLNDGPVFQPSAKVESACGLGLNVWGNMDLDTYDGAYDRGEFSEVDVNLYKTFEFGAFSLEVGYIEYLFPQVHEDNATREAYGTVTYDIGAGFYTGVEYFYDFGEIKDAYADALAGYEVECGRLTTTVEASAGYAGKDWAAAMVDEEDADTGGGWYDYSCSLALAYAVTEAVDVGGTLAYTGSLDKDVLPDQDVDLYGGLSATYSF